MFAVQYPFSIEWDKLINVLRPVSQQWKRHFAKQVTQKAASSSKTLERINDFQFKPKHLPGLMCFPDRQIKRALEIYSTNSITSKTHNAHFEFNFKLLEIL